MPKLHSVSGQTINRPKNAKNPLNISAHVPKQGIYNKIWTFFFYEKKKKWDFVVIQNLTCIYRHLVYLMYMYKKETVIYDFHNLCFSPFFTGWHCTYKTPFEWQLHSVLLQLLSSDFHGNFAFYGSHQIQLPDSSCYQNTTAKYER